MNRFKKLIRTCPICGCLNGTVLHTQRFLLPEGHLLPNQYDVVSCENCGFVFADTSANQEIYDRYYAEMSKYEDVNTASGGGDKPYDLKRLNQTANDIERILTNNKSARILDIGCGNGGLIQIMKERGYKNVVGLDPSETCVNSMKNKGLEACKGGLFSKSEMDKTFDLIILSHVLEHIYDLSNAVSNLKKFLQPNGLVYVETPNAAKYPEYYIVPNYYFDTEHINHFSKLHHQNLFENCGYNLIENYEKEMMVSEVQSYPAVYSVFQFSGDNQKPTPDFLLIEKIMKYIELSENDNRIETINKLYVDQTPVVVWGAGNYTLRLLFETHLGKCNILHFIDSDSKKWNQIINGKTILQPAAENLGHNHVIICSALFSIEITQQIQKLNPDCELTIL